MDDRLREKEMIVVQDTDTQIYTAMVSKSKREENELSIHYIEYSNASLCC